jgi:glycosyltransferase-like protein
MTQPLRIAILTHSTNARGGVVHALALGEALAQLGHTVAVHAPDPSGKGFYRNVSVETVSVAASPFAGGVTAMVETRADEYVRHFEDPANRRFDVFHAQDGISGNALATLKQRRLIHGFARTVHHIDQFEDAKLMQMQRRAIAAADRVFTVSQMWADQVAAEFGCAPTVVGNGVDLARFSPKPAPEDVALRTRLGLRDGPVLLSVGGVEERKNTLAILDAFRQLRAIHPTAQLVIAGGASVLNHDVYQLRFKQRLVETGLPPGAVILAGVLPDAEMPSLYRLADALVFASLREGFGLVVLEAMASGCPVIASHIAPFTEYLTEDSVAWCDPLNPGSIANAMASVLKEALMQKLAASGLVVVRRHDWLHTARAHVPAYESLREVIDA